MTDQKTVSDFLVFYNNHIDPLNSDLTIEDLEKMFRMQGDLLAKLRSGRISYKVHEEKNLAMEKKLLWRWHTFVVKSPEEILCCLLAVTHDLEYAQEEALRLAYYTHLIQHLQEETGRYQGTIVFTLTVTINSYPLPSVALYDHMPEIAPDGSIADNQSNDHLLDSWTKEDVLAYYGFMAKKIPEDQLSENAANLLGL
jgi:hypothetical protein